MGWRTRILQDMRKEEATMVAELEDLRQAIQHWESEMAEATGPRVTPLPNASATRSDVTPVPDELRDDDVKMLIRDLLAYYSQPLSVYRLQEAAARPPHHVRVSMVQLSRCVAALIAAGELVQTDGNVFLAVAGQNGTR